jgi:hypothetical protein
MGECWTFFANTCAERARARAGASGIPDHRKATDATLRVTPAMGAGVAAHVWSIEEIVGLLD